MKKLKVSIPSTPTSYNICIGSDCSTSAVKAHYDNGGFIVVDRNVAELYPSLLPKDRVFVFDASEENKTLESVKEILKWLGDSGALRDSSLMAIGGGITGDTAAFAAAVYMRGIKVIQMPTTLLSMVDSSVGGKTGVNFYGIKNNIGAFHQPSEVIIDTNFLKTLSNDEFLNGFAESLKIAAVADKDFFDFLKNNKQSIITRDSDIMEEVIRCSCALKASIVEADEKESGKRKLLNFGHTIAHAIETDSHHKVHHGYAVAMGMMYETEYAYKKGIADNDVYKAIKDILMLYGYSLEYKPQDREIFIAALAKDKKAAKSGLSLALTGTGMTGKIINGVTPHELGALFFQP